MNLPYFSPADCLRCARASADAYTLANPSWLKPIVLSNDATDTQGIIRFYNDAIVIALRGTTNFRDWQTDCKILREKGVHRGFHAAAKSILPQILDALRASRDLPILVTGHSLGGALAQDIALLLNVAGRRIAGVYTFGQPRVFDGSTRDLYTINLGSRSFRLVNHRDPVPRLPGPLIGYRHAGHELLWRNGQLSVDPSAWSKLGWGIVEGLSACSSGAGWIGLTRTIATAAQIAGDHSMADYLGIAQQIYNSTGRGGMTPPMASNPAATEGMSPSRAQSTNLRSSASSAVDTNL